MKLKLIITSIILVILISNSEAKSRKFTTKISNIVVRMQNSTNHRKYSSRKKDNNERQYKTQAHKYKPTKATRH